MPTHEGRRRFWSGKVDTICGLVLDSSASWTFFGPSCPDCQRILRERKRRK